MQNGRRHKGGYTHIGEQAVTQGTRRARQVAFAIGARAPGGQQTLENVGAARLGLAREQLERGKEGRRYPITAPARREPRSSRGSRITGYQQERQSNHRYRANADDRAGCTPIRRVGCGFMQSPLELKDCPLRGRWRLYRASIRSPRAGH